MWHLLPANTTLYRVTRAQDTWADVLQGLGSFYNHGGRYNRVGQQTVYATPDPLVALCEFAWHSALKHTQQLGDRKSVIYPCTDNGKLWQFQLATPITLVDLTNPAAANRLAFPAHAPTNPHPERYAHCQHIADQVRVMTGSSGSQTRPEGVYAPSLRTPATATKSMQVVLFYMPTPVVPQTLQSRGLPISDWNIELEFLTASNRQPVTPTDLHIAWNRPQFRLSGSANSVPKYRSPSSRARTGTISNNVWHPIDIHYCPH